MIRRRQFIALLGGATAVLPLTARAQQGERVRRIGVLMGLPVTDPESSRRLMAFRQGLQELGWTEGRNVRIDARWEGDADRLRQELIALDPDVILAIGSTTLGRCSGRPARSQLSSRWSPTQLGAGSSRVWLGRAATPPVSRCLNTA